MILVFWAVVVLETAIAMGWRRILDVLLRHMSPQLWLSLHCDNKL
jgi:hypothetical protein